MLNSDTSLFVRSLIYILNLFREIFSYTIVNGLKAHLNYLFFLIEFHTAQLFIVPFIYLHYHLFYIKQTSMLSWPNI